MIQLSYSKVRISPSLISSTLNFFNLQHKKLNAFVSDYDNESGNNQINQILELLHS